MTQMFGLEADAVRRAIHGVRPHGDDADAAVMDAFARAAWTGIAEPGDGVAGALIGVDGASDALTRVIVGEPGHSATARAMQTAMERWRPRLDSALALRALHNAAQLGATLLVPGDPGWPVGFDDLGAHAPIAVWFRAPGRVLPPLSRSIALVGARAASAYGERIAVDAAAGLSDRGFAVVSGAAYGIDGAAHRAALASDGVTVAVLAGGVDRLYPSGHASLLHRIASTGAVIAESPCGMTPTKWRFLQRNRLIAAMSAATVVLEAGARSGSLNTAGHAAELGRPLGAVPGSVYSATSAGCHRLLREYGAVCVRDAADMAELASGVAADNTQPTLDGMDQLPGVDGVDATGRRILDALGPRPRTVLDVARLAGVAESTVSSTLGLLTLSGAAAAVPGGWVRAAARQR